jgi:hypothetical protein
MYLLSDKYKDAVSGTSDLPLSYFRDVAAGLMYEFMIMQGYNVVPILSSHEMEDRLFAGDGIRCILYGHALPNDLRPPMNDALEVNVHNLKMVVGDSAEWRQVKEARSDAEAIQKIRNLRHLFLKEYKDLTSAEEIRDDIDRRIEEYERACRKHGFEMRSTFISSLLDTSSLLGIAAAAAAGVLVGGPVIPTVAAVIGAVMHTGKVSIDLRAKNYAFEADMSREAIAYVVDARRNITGQPKKSWFKFW